MKISEIHDLLYDYLTEWSDGSNDRNRFFYLRTKDDERFKKGYWFPGDEHYVEVSFWTGKDSLNRTSNIYFSVDPKKGIYGNLIARDSENKQAYFGKIAEELPAYKLQGSKKNVWRKRFGAFDKNTFLQNLAEFLDVDKKAIDRILERTLERINEPDYQLLEDEYSSKFGFISEDQFYKLKNRVESERKSRAREQNLRVAMGEVLPYSLSSIEIEKFQGIDKLSVEDIPDNTKWIFLTGENGFGKTSLLQAISLGLTSFEENKKYLSSGSKITVGYSMDGKYVQNTVTSTYNDDFKPLNSNFIAYGPLRLVVQASSSENQESQNSSNVYNLFNRDGLLKNVNYLLKNSSLKKDRSEFESLKKVIIKVLDNRIQDISIDDNGNVQFTENDDNGNTIGKNRLENLATGFQGLINLVGDIIVRFSKDLVPYADYSGIIIIDELENHLHPIFQKKLPVLLSDIFPKIQFISSVHSPIPLLGAPRESVIIKVNRDAAKSITAERVVIDNIETLNPNILLTSAIFGFSSIINDNLIDKSKLRTENSWAEMKEFDELDKRLLEGYNQSKKK